VPPQCRRRHAELALERGFRLVADPAGDAQIGATLAPIVQ
jgi:hypothetical protein